MLMAFNTFNGTLTEADRCGTGIIVVAVFGFVFVVSPLESSSMT